MTDENELQTRRFSTGMEYDPPLQASARAGSFADGMATTAHTRTGFFALGQALRPDAPGVRRVGSFGDTSWLAPKPSPARPRPRAPRLRLRPLRA